MSGFAWVTLATNDSYSLGALVLAHSLKQVGTAHQLVVLVTPGVTNVMRKNLADVFNVVEEVNLFDSKDEANLRLLKRPELGVTFTKLHCWRLTQFEKCVFLDADVLVLANSDELFEREEFSAAPDVGWPDCFNSGVFVYRPSLETYSKLVDFALQKGSFDGGDQGLLNAYFSDWAHKDISKHLPFIYNMCSTASYSYMPAFKYYGANVKIVHFIGPAKPWLQYFDTESRKVHPSPDLQHLQDVLQKWWDLFCSLIHPKLSPDMSGLAGAFAQFTLGVKRSPSQDALENHLRRQAWEVGNIDYMGRDSFDNIWNKICQTLSSTQLRDGAVSSTDTQQTPEIAKDIKTDVQQPEETAPQEQQTILEAAVPEIPQTQEVPASVPEVGDKPQEEVAVIQETVTQKDEIEPKAIEPTVEIPKPDDKPQVTPAVSEVKSEATEILKVDEKLTEPIPQQDVPQEVIAPKEEPAEPVLQQDVAQEVKSEIPTETAEVPKPSETVTEKLVEPTPKLEETAAEKIEDKPSETVAQKVEESTIPKVEDKPSEPETQKAEEAPKVEDIPSEIVAQKVEEIVTLKPEDQASEIVAEKAEEKPSEIVAQKTEQTQVPKEEEKPSETVAQTVQETEIPKTVEQPSETVAQIVQETEIPKTVEQASETVAQILQETEIPKTVEQPSETVAQIMQETEVPKAVEQPSEQLDQPIASLEKESITTTKDEPKLKEIKPELTATAEVPAQEVIVEKIKPKVKKVPTSPAKVVDKPSVELKQPQKEKAAPASPPTPTSPVARETPKEIPPPQKEKVKSESPVDVPKVQAKPEKALESPKPDESSKTEVTAQAETSAEASAEVPKSDTKPKETRKVKKKVKKVVKAADPATAESSQTPEGASKK